MNTRSRHVPPPYHPSEAEIREKALELYIRSGWIPGRDVENWLEAEADLIAQPPPPPPSPHGELRSHSHHVGPKPA